VNSIFVPEPEGLHIFVKFIAIITWLKCLLVCERSEIYLCEFTPTLWFSLPLNALEIPNKFFSNKIHM